MIRHPDARTVQDLPKRLDHALLLDTQKKIEPTPVLVVAFQRCLSPKARLLGHQIPVVHKNGQDQWLC